MQSPRSYGHFEIRLTYEELLVAKLRAFKKKYLEPTAISTSRLLTATQTPPPGSFVHQNSQLCFICANKQGFLAAMHPVLHHQVIAFKAPCLVGFTIDLAADLSHPLKPNQIVVLLVVK